MQFDVAVISDDVIIIMFEDRLIATFDLDYWYQLSSVTLYESSTSSEERLAALRLACWHVNQYVVRREVSAFGGLMINRIGGEQRNFQRSKEPLQATSIPDDTIPNDEATLIDGLKSVRVPVIQAIHSNYKLALDHIVNDASLTSIVSYEIIRHENFDRLVRVRFTVEAPGKFCFWNTVSRAGDLDVIPSYHPVMQGQHYSNLINGDTDALISGDAVRSVCAPAESTATEQHNIFGASWTKTLHPVKAEGQSFEVTISPRHVLSEKGVSTVVSLLADALGSTNTYVGVSGGFRSSYTHPANAVRRYGIRPARGEARGSEGHCAWTYHTLQAEGKLAGSYVPEWFISEGWLKAYPAPREANAPL